MSEYRRNRVIYGNEFHPKVVMTHWVDDKCYILVDRLGHPQHMYFELEVALDTAERNPGLTILVHECIRSHHYDEPAKGFQRCPAVYIPNDDGPSFWARRCPKEKGHRGDHDSGCGYMSPGKWVVT